MLLLAEATKAREIARRAMAFYLPLTNYRNSWKRVGFTDDDLEGGSSDRFIDAMVAWGTERAIRKSHPSAFRCRCQSRMYSATAPRGPTYSGL